MLVVSSTGVFFGGLLSKEFTTMLLSRGIHFEKAYNSVAPCMNTTTQTKSRLERYQIKVERAI